jgi:hypothetical protein
MPEFKITLYVQDDDMGVAIARHVYNEETGELIRGIKRFEIEEVA